MQTTISSDTELASILGGPDLQCQSIEKHNCTVTATHRVRCEGGCGTHAFICDTRAAIIRARILKNSHKCLWCWAMGTYSPVGKLWKLVKA